MRRLRQGSVLFLLVLLAPPTRAQDKPASPWAIDRPLTVSAQGAPVPALRYFLLPPSWELKEGNAVPIYLRLVHEQNDAAQRYWAETPLAWNRLPVNQVPSDEARKFLQRCQYNLRQLEAGARRRTAEWNYTLDVGDPIGLRIPDAQNLRKYVPMLALQVRVAIADGDFPAAAHHLQTGFAMGRHATEGPFLVNSLIGIALAWQFAGNVADFIEQPGSPNLYWALTALPRPLIELRRGEDGEYRILEMVYPELGDLERERTAEQWDGILRRVRSNIQGAAVGDKELTESLRSLKDSAPSDPAAKSPDLPVARKFVARLKGLSADQVAALPQAQVLLLYLVGTYHEYRDELFRTTYLPYPQALPLFDAATRRHQTPPTSEGQWLAHVLLPAVPKVVSAQVRLERNLAALRVVEALRMYAAGHDGRLPEKLEEITEAPVPPDPGTGKPFGYSRDADTATLVGTNNEPLRLDGHSSSNGIRYRVTVRKK
jgi:hypothetical protein